MPSRRLLLTALALAGVGSTVVVTGAAASPASAHHRTVQVRTGLGTRTASLAGVQAARAAEPVVMTGAQIPAWSRVPAEGVANPYPSGAAITGDGVRSAHNGTLTIPPDPLGRTGVDVNQITAYHWTGTKFQQIPVQVDQRFPYFLANGHSSFSTYSGTDEELTYSWAPDAHDIGEEAWKKDFGTCSARYAKNAAEVAQAVQAGVVSPEPSGSMDTAGYLGPMQDPVKTFDDDDQLSFMAGDAGAQAPSGVAAPKGASDGQVVTITDPLDPSATRYVYLYLTKDGSRFNATNGYVHMTRDRNADQWVDRYSFAPTDPLKIGTSNTGYGPNLSGSVCVTSPENDANPKITTPNGQPRPSTDRNPRDGMTVTTPTYRIHADGRWLVRRLQVAQPGRPGHYGPNIIARWKGRAFQQTPDSSVSLVGFEDEQVNWEMNSALLGWRQGPVRAIREVWGADSGTNVTKTETYYRDADVFGYHLRVHPIPPDGLYTDWDYRPGVASTYYNLLASKGVPVDGQSDTNVGEVDQIPVTGQNAEVNVCDPTTQVCSAIENPEEIAGKGFGLVYDFELTGATAAAGNAAVIPYYRDDACFDDGTGDAPVPRPYPGEATTDPRVQQGYVDYWRTYWEQHPQWQRFPEPASYSDLKCQPQLAVNGSPTANRNVPPWQIMPFQGAIGEHGVHFLFTQDSDNTFAPKNTDEVDGQQWRFEIPMTSPTNELIPYGADVSAKLVAVATPAG